MTIGWGLSLPILRKMNCFVPHSRGLPLQGGTRIFPRRPDHPKPAAGSPFIGQAALPFVGVVVGIVVAAILTLVAVPLVRIPVDAAVRAVVPAKSAGGDLDLLPVLFLNVHLDFLLSQLNVHSHE